MSEFETEVSLSGEKDIEIDFSEYNDDELNHIISLIKQRGKYTFKNISVDLSGTTFVEIEPLYSNFY